MLLKESFWLLEFYTKKTIHFGRYTWFDQLKLLNSHYFQLNLKEQFDILGDTLIHFLALCYEKLNATPLSFLC